MNILQPILVLSFLSPPVSTTPENRSTTFCTKNNEKSDCPKECLVNDKFPGCEKWVEISVPATAPQITTAMRVERTEADSRRDRLERSYDDTDQWLLVGTAITGALWGVLTVTTAVVGATKGFGKPALPVTLGVATFGAYTGFVIEAAMLGAHRRTRPLYMAVGPVGLRGRF